CATFARSSAASPSPGSTTTTAASWSATTTPMKTPPPRPRNPDPLAPMKSPALLLAALLGLASVGNASADSLPSPALPASAGTQPKAHTNSGPILAEIGALGFKCVRRGFAWSNIEKSPGEYHFDEYDALVDNAEKRGLRVLGCIALNNGKFPGVREPAGREAFAKFAATVVARYKGRPVIWEIWNEPNIATFWGKHGKANTMPFADEYSEFVKVVAPA